ncbi:phage integrase family protein [Rhodoferax sp. TBRC 17660]|uniref:Phage integrase family protein n=1 Tax=Rhodoferax potami TaxID=3068338 RepID=A0ABU3KS52_9BURK|nr:phage integrase family protein [Rhodoferax sp. TBRC 17660]MDT7520645.1 phage integrase family protein [Rhodoferax sp. TBRC 17660]
MQKYEVASLAKTNGPEIDGFPRTAELAALRAWYSGMSTRDAVDQYLGDQRLSGQSSRSQIGNIRRKLATLARLRRREDLASAFEHSEQKRIQHSRAAVAAIELLRTITPPAPQITDDIGLWLSERSVRSLKAHGIDTLADLTVRVPRRRRWWVAVPGLGVTGARQIEAFFSQHPQLVERARALIVRNAQQEVQPWEMLVVPGEVDGSRGTFRAPPESCTLNSANDYEAVQAWLSLHEAAATQRAYRKEAERLILWAIVERGKALSSLNTEDAIAYRAFLRHPTPARRWIGPPQARTSPDWKPFVGGLAPRSVAYALAVLGAMFRWLMEQRYVLANPFSGVKVRGASHAAPMDTGRVFSEGEWAIIRAVADGLEWTYGWQVPAAQRLRFVLDFAYATGLRVSELVGAKLGQIEVDSHGDHWIKLVGKGSKSGKVALPPLVRSALDHSLMQRGLPITPAHWEPSTPLIADLGDPDGKSGITATRVWSLMKRFFTTVATAIEKEAPATAEKLRKASPHWMRHTHATHALARGAELTTVRDNLRHASVATTSIYLHTDEVKRARQMGDAFGARS